MKTLKKTGILVLAAALVTLGAVSCGAFDAYNIEGSAWEVTMDDVPKTITFTADKTVNSDVDGLDGSPWTVRSASHQVVSGAIIPDGGQEITFKVTRNGGGNGQDSIVFDDAGKTTGVRTN